MPYCIKDNLVYLVKYINKEPKFKIVKLSRFLPIIGDTIENYTTDRFKHVLLTDADDIEYAYRYIGDSCMKEKYKRSRVYADNDKIAVMVIYTANDWRSSGKVRILVNIACKTYYNCYGDGSIRTELIQEYLGELGYKQDDFFLDDVYLQLIFAQDNSSLPRYILLPFIDGQSRALSIVEVGGDVRLQCRKNGNYYRNPLPFNYLRGKDILLMDKKYKESSNIY